MARMKFPGTNKSRSSPENKKKLNMLGRRGKERTAGKRQGSAITPVLISLRRYREIFGDSDEEEEDFYGFRAEELGLKAYRSFSVKEYLDGSERVNYRKDGVRDSQSRNYSISHSPKLSQESAHRKREARETGSKKSASPSSENIYAKQYRKRESYERRFAPPLAKVVFEKACLPPNLKSTTKVKANFVPRVSKPTQLVIGKSLKVYERNLFPYAKIEKRKTIPVAKQLLAKAKGGQRIRVQKGSVNKGMGEVRSRSGRVVKSKKLDYDDVTSPKFKTNRKEIRLPTRKLNNQGRKRPLEEGNSEHPPRKAIRVGEVKIEKVQLSADQRVYVENPVSPTGFDIQPLEAVGTEYTKSSFAEESGKDLSPSGNHYVPKKARIKNAKRIKNAVDLTNHYQLAKFPGENAQKKLGPGKAQQVRTSNSNDEISSWESSKDERQTDGKESLGSVKRSERIKIKREKQDLEDQVSDTSSVSDISSLNGDVGKRKTYTPLLTNKTVFRSKRLQELQEKMESVETIDDFPLNNDNLGDFKKRVNSQRNENDSESERSSYRSSRSQSRDGDRICVNSDDEHRNNEMPEAAKKRRLTGKKMPLSRIQAVKKENEIPSSSEDEESNKPLSELKKDIKKSEEEPTERVVKKVIKVVRKIKTKSGETKTKVIKIIRKVAVRKKKICEVVSGRRRIRCGNCKGCKVSDDCGTCRWCKDKPKFGGPGTSKQSCVKRKCLNPQPPKSKGSGTPRKIEKAKPKMAPKKDLNLKERPSVNKKEQDQRPVVKRRGKHPNKPAPCGKRQALLDDKNLVKLPWSDNSTEEEIWKEGFAVCFTAGVPDIIKELCFLCGSKGNEKMFYCRVCAEPFHGFCLDETPVDESTWCCDNCSSCSVCGYQDKLLMCDRCQRGYHVECLGPYYPTEPEGEDDVWVCGRCVQCKNCGRRTAGDKPDALWMLEFTHCQDCGRQREQRNFCPLCDKCYSDDDFESKMVHCVDCGHWVHAECQGITPDQYECLSDLPEDVQFVCRQCQSEQETSPWYRELMEEMEAGFERVVDEVKHSKAYEQFVSHFEQCHMENGHPKDMDGIMAKVREWKYITVENFCNEVQGILDKLYGFSQGNAELVKQWTFLYVTFCKEVALMFPWFKLKSKEQSEEEQLHIIPNGVLGSVVHYATWDHTYARLEESQEKSDSLPVTKSPSFSQKSSPTLPRANEFVDNNEKMDVDFVPSQKTEFGEEPMETEDLIEQKKPDNESDSRKCLLCNVTKDAEASGPGRLLSCGLDEWVHINCGLWSAEVFEDDEGRLQNVQVALSRGKQMKCEYCGEVGATVGCCEPRCPMNYHFMCARNAEAQFQDDKRVYCAQHSFRAQKELLMVADDFCVERRVCVDMSKIRATKKLSRGFEPQSINLVQGSLTLDNMGKLSGYSDTKQTLYPINYRISRLYWSIKDPTKRCRYYCTVKEKKSVKTNTKKAQQEQKDLKEQEHVHRVISHEELNKKEKAMKVMTPLRGDVKLTPQAHTSNKPRDYLNSSYGKKLKKIAPHPGPSLVNHSPFSGVMFKDTISGASGTATPFSKLRRILPATQKPSLSLSPTHSAKKMLQHIAQQASNLPAILNSLYPEKMPVSVSSSVPKPAAIPAPNSPSFVSTTPPRNRKTPPGVRRSISFEETIPQTVRQINCDHEVVTKVAGAELSISPIKEKPKSWLLKGREKDAGAKFEELGVTFVITSEEGLKIEADTCDAAWKQVFNMVQEARIDRRMKLVPFAGVNGRAMFGVCQESLVSMLEQLPGAHQLKQYSFKYNPPFDITSLEGTAEQVLKENPHGCARAEEFVRSKKYDMFAFLASPHRVAPQLEESTEEQENPEQMRDGPLTVKRPTCLDLPMAMRYRHLKQCSFNKDTVAVYRSPIHGRGLFCTRNIAAGEMVIEYSGMLVRSILTDKREKYYESKGIGCYMFRIDGTYVVDATMCGNAARFINHSCESNCYSRVVNIDGQKKILIFASRSISRGEELTYDYKFPIEDEKLPCLCNSKHCRKYLN